MKSTIILGAGLTGLSTAYHLEQSKYTDYQIFEKEKSSGGLCRSIFQDGFTFDYTGHLLHINNSYFKELIETIFGFENLEQIQRRSFIYSHQTYTPFPFQMNLHGLPKEVIADCINGFISRKKNISKKSPHTFLDWAQNNFGNGITRHFFKPYQKKIFACNLKDITASWTGRFVPKTNLKDMLYGALEPRQPKVGYNSDFYYPKKGGIFRWVNGLYSKLHQPVAFEQTVKKIDIKNKIVFFTNGNFTNYKKLITTLPLDYLLSILHEPSDSFLKKAATKLRCNSVLNFNLGINKPDLTDKHWVYFPEKKFPQYRLGFYHNLCPAMVPEGCSSLYGEIAYFENNKYSLKQKLKMALKETFQLFNIDQKEVITEKNILIKRAYVTYDFWRERNIKNIHKKLNSYEIYSIGRYGGWKYNSMQEAVLEGKGVAEQIIKEYTEGKIEPFYRKKKYEQKLL